jgi:tetratricopeptide (TPR) repeat protein
MINLEGDRDYSSELRLQNYMLIDEIVKARNLIETGDLTAAEKLLRNYLSQKDINNSVAFHMLADIGVRLGYYNNSEGLFKRVIELEPTWLEPRYGLGLSLFKQGKIQESLSCLKRLLELDPNSIQFNTLNAEILVSIGEYEDAILAYEKILDIDGLNPRILISYAHNLKTIGRIDDSIRAYREALKKDKHLGEAWWSLANLKTYKFSSCEIEYMLASLGSVTIGDENKSQLEFAIAKAYEDDCEYKESFTHYSAGNNIIFENSSYDKSILEDHVINSKKLFTEKFLADRYGEGCPAKDPIFIVGMHRAGSTLIEQILSSHSEVEGTFELTDMPALVKEWTSPPACIDKITAEGLNFIGNQYIERTKIQRKTTKPYFIDKFPSNWQHVPFIHMILPNAIIIDARRNPMACCFSNYKQYYALGHDASYDLSAMGHLYVQYVELMRHIDKVLPNRVYRVIHERLVDNPEDEIRSLLDACGLRFEESCLKFFQNKRPVRTPSAEQVRQPMNREATEAWMKFEPYLNPLRLALGEVLDSYDS